MTGAQFNCYVPLLGTPYSDLTDADFGNANLTNVDFGRCTLSGANFVGATMAQTRFYWTDLSGAAMDGGNLAGNDFGYSNMTGASVTNANLTAASLAYSTLTNAVLTGATVAQTDFSNSNLTRVQLLSTRSYQTKDLHAIKLPGSASAHFDVSNASLGGGNLTDACLRYSTLTGADLHNADLTGADLSYTTLTGANLSGATLANTSFMRSNLTADQLYSTLSYQKKDLHGVAFGADYGVKSDLTGWDFSNQDLTSASFYDATLTNANLAGAAVTHANFGRCNITNSQLYSTRSYQLKDLHGITLTACSLAGCDLSNQNLADAVFDSGTTSGADLTSANLSGANLTKSWMETVNLTNANLRGVDLTGSMWCRANLAGADLTGANATGADLSQTKLSGANLTNATINGAYLWSTGLTAAQLYSTASYKAKDLRGVSLGGSNNANDVDLTNWNFAGQNLTHSSISYAVLTGADFSDADLRGTDFSGQPVDAIARNTILSNGTVSGLNLIAAECFPVRNFDVNSPGRYFAPVPKCITILGQASFDSSASLQIVLDGQPWGSTIAFANGIPVALGGELDLTLAQGVDLSSLVGDTFKLFDWSGVSPTGQFQIVADPGWDISQLYTTGQVTYLGTVPEPSTIALLAVGAVALCLWPGRRR